MVSKQFYAGARTISFETEHPGRARTIQLVRGGLGGMGHGCNGSMESCDVVSPCPLGTCEANLATYLV